VGYKSRKVRKEDSYTSRKVGKQDTKSGKWLWTDATMVRPRERPPPALTPVESKVVNKNRTARQENKTQRGEMIE
jgi:hypothetical protein